jgi:hypothetical protein
VVKQERAGKIKGAEKIRAFLGPIFRIAKQVGNCAKFESLYSLWIQRLGRNWGVLGA